MKGVQVLNWRVVRGQRCCHLSNGRGLESRGIVVELQGWKKVLVIGVAAVVVVSTPFLWLLDGPEAGQFAGASVQAAAGVLTLVWAILQRPERGPADTAIDTGEALAEDGGTALTGIRRPGGEGDGTAVAEATGDATATGDGSSAVSGIDYST